jgi:acetyl esterase/lipase
MKLRASLLILLSACSGGGAGEGEPPAVENVPYGTVPEQKLDIYAPADAAGAPVIVWVHGGGWHNGDKNGVRGSSLAAWVAARGAVLVSIDFRQVPDVTWDRQAQDVADAVAYVHANIADHGGDPERIVLLGHSSGAHLVSLVGSAEPYLGAHGLAPSDLAGVIALDANAYDIPHAIANSDDWPDTQRNLPRIFSADAPTQRQASPITHVDAARRYAPFLVVYALYKAGSQGPSEYQELSLRESTRFVEALVAAGVDATLFGDETETHASLIADFGAADDAVTAAVVAFLDARGL